MTEVYQSNDKTDVVEDTLEVIVREGAILMLAAALEEEVNSFLGRDRYERSEEFHGYRNGYHRSQDVSVGVSAVEVKVPRVSDVPEEVSAEGYNSQIVRRYERSSRQTQELFRKLYMEELSTGDFEPVFRELVGETMALSANAIVRLKNRWEVEYRSWRSSRLDEWGYAYIWADGVYLGASGDREKTALPRPPGRDVTCRFIPGFSGDTKNPARDVSERSLGDHRRGFMLDMTFAPVARKVDVGGQRKPTDEHSNERICWQPNLATVEKYWDLT